MTVDRVADLIALHLEIPSHFFFSGIIVYITIFNDLYCRQFFPDSITIVIIKLLFRVMLIDSNLLFI